MHHITVHARESSCTNSTYITHVLYCTSYAAQSTTMQSRTVRYGTARYSTHSVVSTVRYNTYNPYGTTCTVQYTPLYPVNHVAQRTTTPYITKNVLYSDWRYLLFHFSIFLFSFLFVFVFLFIFFFVEIVLSRFAHFVYLVERKMARNVDTTLTFGNTHARTYCTDGDKY